jgi:hypothetical protein
MFVLSAMRFFPMQQAVDYHALLLDFKQDPEIAHSQPALGCEVGQSLPRASNARAI